MDKAMDNDLICIPNDGKDNLQKEVIVCIILGQWDDIHKFIGHCIFYYTWV